MTTTIQYQLPPLGLLAVQYFAHAVTQLFPPHGLLEKSTSGVLRRLFFLCVREGLELRHPLLAPGGVVCSQLIENQSHPTFCRSNSLSSSDSLWQCHPILSSPHRSHLESQLLWETKELTQSLGFGVIFLCVIFPLHLLQRLQVVLKGPGKPA